MWKGIHQKPLIVVAWIRGRGVRKGCKFIVERRLLFHHITFILKCFINFKKSCKHLLNPRSEHSPFIYTISSFFLTISNFIYRCPYHWTKTKAYIHSKPEFLQEFCLPTKIKNNRPNEKVNMINPVFSSLFDSFKSGPTCCRPKSFKSGSIMYNNKKRCLINYLKGKMKKRQSYFTHRVILFDFFLLKFKSWVLNADL